MFPETLIPRLSRRPCEYYDIFRFPKVLTHTHSRKAAMTAHPDKGGSEAKMAAVNEAYEVLSNPGRLNRLCSQTVSRINIRCRAPSTL